MRTSIATVCVSGTLAEKLDAIAAAGFDGIELFETDLVTSPLSPEEVAGRCADLGLTIDLYQPFRDFEGVEPSVLAANLRRADRKFELMHRLGTDRILVCSNVGTATVPYDETAVDQLGRLAELAAEHEVVMAYEALAWGKYVSTYDHAWRIVEQVAHPALGVCLDSFHILSRGSSLDTIADIPGEKIAYAQLADAPRMNLDALSWSRHYRLFPGEGSWDLADFVARMLAAGYTGPLSLEVFNDVFRESDPRVTAVDARRSLVALEDEVARRNGDSALEVLPAPIELGGFSFVELAPGVSDPRGSDGSASETLSEPSSSSDVERMLQALGFTETGSHRRKNVALWQQGDARIVVNHGLEASSAGIAALGFDVRVVREAAARADALQNDVLHRDHRAGEDELLAVRAPDGTEVYFSELSSGTGGGAGRRWTAEFGDGDASVPSAHPLRIDHVALVQPWDRVEEAVLFYRSLLDLTATEFVDVPGASGLVRSRSLVSPAGGIRLALNALPDHARDDSDYPNHIALVTDDLLGLLRRLDGLPLLEVPGNYYDDLDARYGLAPGLLDELRAANVLLDRAGDGEFLHAYTRPVGRVFFELIERRGGYDGYGAANAPVRLAAQRRLTGALPSGTSPAALLPSRTT
ncbi:bifunctional sugar phosphate isomerase/epimerase/4-hydroxyphenylpyruvate dioxygenase family protein [Herbiconiux ginsengi]|uniref:3-dehydroshikimate dehydratase n=1 Tax=Herbiconiux ginsengi TaxID=381665 RepID=A0A1H3RKY8_9MICO|nr:sugar phosphate isomerase/epimerase and 4-hydroxyphenylpyruvate domain-containing protein [Herbiconiux ginsengi]SDZ26326.1 4-hydroxyphenylpyruvate dioxygenase [Herbiconiux ginsengi]